MRRILIPFVLLACSCLQAQEMKTFVVAERRQGVIEFIDPVTLSTVGQIHFDVRNTAGLNGMVISRDGALLYVEGPITGPEGAGSCCYLYSIDLATLQAKKVAGIWGTRSRAAFVISSGMMYPMSESFARGFKGQTSSGTTFINLSGTLDPTGHYLFRVRNFQGPALDVFDLAQGTLVRRLIPAEFDGGRLASGAWLGDRFFLYGTRDHGSAARLWSVSADATQLGPGMEVKTSGKIPSCSIEPFEEITVAGGNLFLYEKFGTKFDRRGSCGSEIPGGAWVVDPETGQLLHHYAPQFHFTDIIPDRTEPVRYMDWPPRAGRHGKRRWSWSGSMLGTGAHCNRASLMWTIGGSR